MTRRVPSTSRTALAERVLKNKAVFEDMVAGLSSLESDDEIISGVSKALEFQMCHSTCYYSCDAIEEALQKIARRHSVPLANEYKKDSVLHVMTVCLPVGGHSRIVERWIARAPAFERHSVIILGQPDEIAPSAALLAAAGGHGGTVERVDHGSELEKALFLRQQASHFERIVLHTNPDDIIPVLAFGTKDFLRPVLLFNHADHVFGLGVSIADAFLDIREYGRNLSMLYRGVLAPAILHLPFDDGNSQKTLTASQSDVREELHLPKNGKIIVSAGSTYKFQRFLQWDFIVYMATVLQRRDDIRFVIAGPSAYTGKRFRDRITTIGMVKPDVLLKYFKAADLVVDSFPFGGGTSLQDAVSVGSAVLSMESVAGKMDYIKESAAYVKTIDELIDSTMRVLDDRSYADYVREDVWQRLQGERSCDKWNANIAAAIAGIRVHDVHKFVSTPRLPVDDTDLFVEFCHIHIKRKDILGLASVFSFREDGKKCRTIEFFSRRDNTMGDLK